MIVILDNRVCIMNYSGVVCIQYVNDNAKYYCIRVSRTSKHLIRQGRVFYIYYHTASSFEAPTNVITYQAASIEFSRMCLAPTMLDCRSTLCHTFEHLHHKFCHQC